MFKWIKNSKAAKTNTTSKYRGVRKTQHGNYEASVILSKYNNLNERIQHKFIVGTFKNEKEAAKNRVDFILNLL